LVKKALRLKRTTLQDVRALEQDIIVKTRVQNIRLVTGHVVSGKVVI